MNQTDAGAVQGRKFIRPDPFGFSWLDESLCRDSTFFICVDHQALLDDPDLKNLTAGFSAFMHSRGLPVSLDRAVNRGQRSGNYVTVVFKLEIPVDSKAISDVRAALKEVTAYSAT